MARVWALEGCLFETKLNLSLQVSKEIPIWSYTFTINDTIFKVEATYNLAVKIWF